jgi:hypothetical protein
MPQDQNQKLVLNLYPTSYIPQLHPYFPSHDNVHHHISWLEPSICLTHLHPLLHCLSILVQPLPACTLSSPRSLSGLILQIMVFIPCNRGTTT